MISGRRRAVLIAGPTASGKSALAIEMARQIDAVIVNADAMQVYDTLRVVTARPGPEDEALAEHRLYGTVPAGERFSTGKWLAAAAEEWERAEGRTVIFVGGTGLYFDALLNGLADVPEISEAVVLEVQQEIQALDEAGRMALLMAEDAETAGRLKVADPQRVTRALAVKRATGRALSSFQARQHGGMLAGMLAANAVERVVLEADRTVLRERIALRFASMFENGAVEEVEALLAQKLDPGLPAMKAIGVPEIAAWLRGEMSKEEAIERATIATQQYAKRQRTWFRNRMADWPRRQAAG